MSPEMLADLRRQARDFRDRGGINQPHNRRAIGLTMSVISHRRSRRKARERLRLMIMRFAA